ncbi:MAG: hypothetical protein WA989_02205 [Henriciella sp.]|uniref:hypothetical protein n=1 Tax=Henriciella sp. TaxID=1968823 RepID=UPI003C72674C
MAHRFTFDNAFLHFARTEGPRGFVWKYLIAYGVTALLIAAVGYVLFKPFLDIWFGVFIDVVQGQSESEMEAIFVRRITEIAGWLVFSYIAMIVLGILFWAVFEAAVQRHYVRDEGFRMRLGGDELRLIVVGLIWFVFMFFCQIATFMAVSVTTGSIVYALDNEVAGAITFVAAFAIIGFVWLWLVIRLAPASAMTVRDRKIKFFDAWGASRGRFWSLLGAYIVLAIIIWFAAVITWFVFGTSVMAALMNQVAAFESAADNPLALFNLIMTFDVLGPLATAYLGWLLLQGFFIYMWAGPAALAAKTDPRGGSITQAPDVFA